MEKYKDYSPTAFDPKGAFLPDQGKWEVLPVIHTRDSGPLDRSNFKIALKMLGDEKDHIIEVHRFGHWAAGWFEIIIVNPKAGITYRKAVDIENSLADYPILDESDYSEMETNEANEVWANCYDVKDRIQYIRDNPDQFDFCNYADLRACIKGEFFNGYASELLD